MVRLLLENPLERFPRLLRQARGHRKRIGPQNSVPHRRVRLIQAFERRLESRVGLAGLSEPLQSDAASGMDGGIVPSQLGRAGVIRQGLGKLSLLQAKETAAFRSLMEYEAERARGYYQKAMSALPSDDRRAQRPGLIMAAIYRTLLDEIQREGFQVLTRRTSLTPLRKFWIAWRTWVAA